MLFCHAKGIFRSVCAVLAVIYEEEGAISSERLDDILRESEYTLLTCAFGSLSGMKLKPRLKRMTPSSAESTASWMLCMRFV